VADLGDERCLICARIGPLDDFSHQRGHIDGDNAKRAEESEPVCERLFLKRIDGIIQSDRQDWAS